LLKEGTFRVWQCSHQQNKRRKLHTKFNSAAYVPTIRALVNSTKGTNAAL